MVRRGELIWKVLCRGGRKKNPDVLTKARVNRPPRSEPIEAEAVLPNEPNPALIIHPLPPGAGGKQNILLAYVFPYYNENIGDTYVLTLKTVC